EPPPETTRLRVHHSLSLCLAPQYVAEDLLRAEGFTDVQYVRPYGATAAGVYQALESGEADIANDFATVGTLAWTGARRSSSWPVSMSAASSCSAPRTSGRFVT